MVVECCSLAHLFTGALFGTLSGNTREVLHKFSVDLPKKHGRGGGFRLLLLKFTISFLCLRSVCFAFCSVTDGKTSQFCPKVCRGGSSVLHYQ